MIDFEILNEFIFEDEVVELVLEFEWKVKFDEFWIVFVEDNDGSKV